MLIKLLTVSLLYIFDKCFHVMCKHQILIWFADSYVNKVITKIPFHVFLGEKTVKQQVEAFFGTFDPAKN